MVKPTTITKTLDEYPLLKHHLHEFEIIRQNNGLPPLGTLKKQVANIFKNHCSVSKFINDMRSQRVLVRIEKERRNRESRKIRETKKNRHEVVFKEAIQVARKLQSNSQIKLKGGYIYLIDNPAFPGCFKIGCSLDVTKRLQSYQTSDPYRSFRVVMKRFVPDRIKAEHASNNSRSAFILSGEWVKVDKPTILKNFKETQKKVVDVSIIKPYNENKKHG